MEPRREPTDVVRVRMPRVRASDLAPLDLVVFGGEALAGHVVGRTIPTAQSTLADSSFVIMPRAARRRSMPTLDENLHNWTADWDWSQRGDEWSRWWGDTPALWYGALLPRLHAMLPAESILEIAPGYGRWTEYLKDLTEHLVIVDLTEKCIEHCRDRFASSANIAYHVNDGRSLEMVEDDSIDLVFSFDSLVHAEPEIIGGYLEQLARKLRPDGIGFLHHSNAGTVKRLSALTRRIPNRFFEPLVHRGVAVNLSAWRDDRMSAALFREQCSDAGLMCVGQELVSWEFGGYLIDCFSVFTRSGSRWDRPMQLLRNPMFVAEARRMSRLYAGSSFR
jgi:SAM-dependent methyltransferase